MLLINTGSSMSQWKTYTDGFIPHRYKQLQAKCWRLYCLLSSSPKHLCAVHFVCTSQNCRSYRDHLRVQENSDTVKLTPQMKYLKENKKCVIPDSSQSLSPWVGANHTKRGMHPQANSRWKKNHILYFSSTITWRFQNIWQTLVHFTSKYFLQLAKYHCSPNKG